MLLFFKGFHIPMLKWISVKCFSWLLWKSRVLARAILNFNLLSESLWEWEIYSCRLPKTLVSVLKLRGKWFEHCWVGPFHWVNWQQAPAANLTLILLASSQAVLMTLISYDSAKKCKEAPAGIHTCCYVVWSQFFQFYDAAYKLFLNFSWGVSWTLLFQKKGRFT